MSMATVATFGLYLVLVTPNEEAAPPMQDSAPSSEVSEAYHLQKTIAQAAATTVDNADHILATVRKMGRVDRLDVRSAFYGAEVAASLGASSTAINILERLVREQPNMAAPGMNLTVDILGHFWIGAYARRAGDGTLAQNVYNTLLQKLDASTHSGVIKMRASMQALCWLYLAEIKTAIHNQPDLAKSMLQRICDIPLPANSQDARLLAFYKDWAHHMLHTLAVAEANRNTDVDQGAASRLPDGIAAFFHLALAGLGDPGDLSHLCRNHSVPLTEWSLRMAGECRTSPIDKAIAHFALAHLLRKRGQLGQAEESFTDLFNSNTPLAADAGIALARCQNHHGKLEEARRTLEQVASRYPSFEEYVGKLRKEWSVTAKSNQNK